VFVLDSSGDEYALTPDGGLKWIVPVAGGDGPAWAGVGPWWATGISFVVGFTVRVTALYRAWDEPLAKEPAGAYQHSDGRPLLGRKLAGKSQRELRDLGLVIEDGRIVEEAGQPG